MLFEACDFEENDTLHSVCSSRGRVIHRAGDEEVGPNMHTNPDNSERESIDFK